MTTPTPETATPETATPEAPRGREIGDSGMTASEFAAYYAQQRAQRATFLQAPVVPGDVDGHVPDVDLIASHLSELARLETLRDLWERAAAGDPHSSGRTRGGSTPEVAWRIAVRQALRLLRADSSASSLARHEIDRARRAAARQWLTDVRTHGALDPTMLLELL